MDLNDKLNIELSRRLGGVLEPLDVRQRMLGQPPAAALSELGGAYGAAVDVIKADPAAGLEQLKRIITEIERLPESEETYAQWTRAILRLARARLEYASSPLDAQQAIVEAKGFLERLLKADPDIVVDPVLHSRRLERLASEVRERLKQIPSSTLVVRSSCDNTKVFVEGRHVGKAPVMVKLPKGRYRVSGLCASMRAATAIATLTDDEVTVSLDFSLAAIARPASGPGLALAMTDEEHMMGRIAGWLGMDRVVALRLVAENEESFLVASLIQVDTAGARTLRTGWLPFTENAVPVEGLAELAGFITTGKASDRVASTPPASIPSKGILDRVREWKLPEPQENENMPPFWKGLLR